MSEDSFYQRMIADSKERLGIRQRECEMLGADIADAEAAPAMRRCPLCSGPMRDASLLWGLLARHGDMLAEGALFWSEMYKEQSHNPYGPECQTCLSYLEDEPTAYKDKAWVRNVDVPGKSSFALVLFDRFQQVEEVRWNYNWHVKIRGEWMLIPGNAPDIKERLHA